MSKIVNLPKFPRGFEFLGPKPYFHQEQSIKFGMLRDNTGLLLDVGLGKTKVAIDLARYRIQYDNVKKVLVVCPPSLLINWKEQIELWSEYSAIVLNASKKTRIKRVIDTSYQFYIINYESLFPLLRDFGVLVVDKYWSKRAKKFIRKYKVIDVDVLKTVLNFDMVIYDESSRYLKSHSSQRTRAAIVLSSHAKYHLLLTATLIGNVPMNLWSQFMCLDKGKSFGSNFYAFRNKFFAQEDFGLYKKYKLKKKYVSYFQRKIKESCIRFEQDECLDLPYKVLHKIPLPLEGRFKKDYINLQNKIISEIETLEGTEVFNIRNVLTKLIRLQQMTGGFIKNESTIKDLPSQLKLDALIEEIKSVIEADQSVVIWCRFRHSIDLISNRLEELDIKHVTMDGRITNKTEKYNIWKGYQESDEVNVFIGQLESGGFGIELFKIDSNPKQTQNMFIYENVWSPDVRDQIMGRIRRIGQNSRCRYVDIYIKNTIDERILNAVQSKKKVADLLVKGGVRQFLLGG